MNLERVLRDADMNRDDAGPERDVALGDFHGFADRGARRGRHADHAVRARHQASPGKQPETGFGGLRDRVGDQRAERLHGNRDRGIGQVGLPKSLSGQPRLDAGAEVGQLVRHLTQIVDRY